MQNINKNKVSGKKRNRQSSSNTSEKKLNYDKNKKPNKFKTKRNKEKFNPLNKEEKLNPNEELKKLILGGSKNKNEEDTEQNSQENNDRSNRKKLSTITNQLEKQHSHIFGSQINLEKAIKKQRNKYIHNKTNLIKSADNTKIPSNRIKINSLLGKNILYYLNDKTKNIINNDNEKKFEKKLENFSNCLKNQNEYINNHSIKFDVNYNVLEKIKFALNNIKIKKSETYSENEEDEIFKDIEENSEIKKNQFISQTKLKLTNDEDDIFKYKEIDLSTLLNSNRNKNKL